FKDLYAVDSILFPWFEAPWATAPLTIVLGGLILGERPTARRVIKTLFHTAHLMFLYQGILRALLMSPIFYWLVPARLPFFDEVILLERGSWSKVLRRSDAVCGQDKSELFLQWMAQVFFGALFVGCFWAGTDGLFNALFGTELTWDEPGWSDLRGIPFQLALW